MMVLRSKVHATARLFSHLTPSDAQRKTIYALSTPHGKAGVGVVRISGPDALSVWKGMVKTWRTSPEPWKMHKCQIIHPLRKEVLDSGLAVLFAAPKSFTTEDVLELHIHSGRAVVASVLDALSSFPYCRPAEAGEFTRRAFLAGRLDLTQVEGIKDLIDAETELQHRAALRAAEGSVRAQYEELRSQTIQCLALVEALIDFGEGEDIEEGVFEQARTLASKLNDKIKSYLEDHRRGEIIRSGIRLAIFGPPNAGKSTLFNFLAQREAAIVTPIAGTTRDVLGLSLDIDGVPVSVSDTAGIHDTNDQVEIIGVGRAKDAVRASDVSLCVLSLPDIDSQEHKSLLLSKLIGRNTFFLFNKSDLLCDKYKVMHAKERTWTVSLSTGDGLDQFLKGFSAALRERFHLNDAQAPLITRARHRVHLKNASRFLEAFLQASPNDVVIAAEELRYAAQAIGKVSGLIDTEDVLDALFREFCIGK